MTKTEFLFQARRVAEAASKESGLPVEVTVAQAALESNWGRSELSGRANNYFGIKAHGKHETVQFRTCECDAKGRQVVTASFAKYASMEECFACRDQMILKSVAYADARGCAGDPEAFVRALAKHWATDPRYAEKVLAVMAKIRKLEGVEER